MVIICCQEVAQEQDDLASTILEAKFTKKTCPPPVSLNASIEIKLAVPYQGISATEKPVHTSK